MTCRLTNQFRDINQPGSNLDKNLSVFHVNCSFNLCRMANCRVVYFKLKYFEVEVDFRTRSSTTPSTGVDDDSGFEFVKCDILYKIVVVFVICETRFILFISALISKDLY